MLYNLRIKTKKLPLDSVNSQLYRILVLVKNVGYIFVELKNLVYQLKCQSYSSMFCMQIIFNLVKPTVKKRSRQLKLFR